MHSVWLDLTDHRCSTPDFSVPTPPHPCVPPSTVPTHGSCVSQVLAPHCQQIHSFNLTSKRRPEQGCSKTEVSHETCVPLCLIAVVPRHYLDISLGVLASLNGLSCQPPICTYPPSYADPPNRNIGIWHSPRIRYRAVIKISLHHFSPQPALVALSLCRQSLQTGLHLRLVPTGSSSPASQAPPLQTAILHNYSCFRMFLSGRGSDRTLTSTLEKSLPPAEWQRLHPHAVRPAALTARQPQTPCSLGNVTARHRCVL